MEIIRELVLAESQAVTLVGTNSGMEIRGITIASGSTEFHMGNYGVPEDDLLRAFRTVLPLLLEQELATSEEDIIRFTPEQLYALYSGERRVDFGLFALLPPMWIHGAALRNIGPLASPTLRFEAQFSLAGRRTEVARLGCFLQCNGRVYLLPDALYRLIERIEVLNAAAPPEDGDWVGRNLRGFGLLKPLCLEANVELSRTLLLENVVVPDKVKPIVVPEQGNYISVRPSFDGVDIGKLHDSYLQSPDSAVHNLVTPEGGRVRVVLDPEIRAAVRHMRKELTCIGGNRKDQVIFAPEEAFQGACSLEALDLSEYGPRVRGIGPYVFQPRPFVKHLGAGFLGGADDGERRTAEVGLSCQDINGNEITLPLRGESDIADVLARVEEAERLQKAGIMLVDSEGSPRVVPVSETLRCGLQELQQQVRLDRERRANSRPTKAEPQRECRYVLVYENDESLEFQSKASDIEGVAYHKPRSLVETLNGKPFELKPFQRDGVAWLQANFVGGIRHGVLLADDMGLGKTLQVLAFLAWCIEESYASKFPDTAPPDGYEEPILVVAPLILLDNWKGEMEKFFKGSGAIFSPCQILSSGSIAEYRIPEVERRETETGLPALDLAKLRRNRLVITNYETIRNYQHSFSRVRWSVVIADEAQRIKDAKTGMALAAKALNARFCIAMSGTPVENRLLDLWSIMDFVQPGLLGTSKSFSQQFEADIHLANPEERNRRAGQLKHLLHQDVGVSTYVYNRRKEDFLGSELPPLTATVLSCRLDEAQLRRQREIVALALEDGQHLLAIQQLRRMSEHIALVTDGYPEGDAEKLVRDSSKLQIVLEQLNRIKATGEKVLLFTSSIRMQRILKTVIDRSFGTEAHIINGSTRGGGSSGVSYRFELIRQFEDHPGFDALILSPQVAGVGLTIVEANHIIHYGRWWNPAVEAQATCRAYRIGQTRPVSVYYPMAIHPETPTFDEKLHELLGYKSKLRQDFLVPVTEMEITEAELWTRLTSTTT